MRAEVYRDAGGFWAARIEDEASSPEERRAGRVYMRRTLPVPASATREEAESALRRIMSREARCANGHR